jgi:caffeoyl-CoA O-methyltransferase
MVTYNDNLSHYITDLFARQDDILKQVRENIPKKGLPEISIRPEEGRFLQFMVRACAAMKALEIGTLGGYSGIWIARGLRPGGRLITLEKDPRHAEVARDHFIAAGVEDKVEIRIGDAHDLLNGLENEGLFDFIFIDAEKSGYRRYFQWALEHSPIGGIVAAHNAFRGGRVQESQPDDIALQMDSFNRQVASNHRVISTIYPSGDGTLISVKIK